MWLALYETAGRYKESILFGNTPRFIFRGSRKSREQTDLVNRTVSLYRRIPEVEPSKIFTKEKFTPTKISAQIKKSFQSIVYIHNPL